MVCFETPSASGSSRTRGVGWGLHGGFPGWVPESSSCFPLGKPGKEWVLPAYPIPGPADPLIYQGGGQSTWGWDRDSGPQSLSEPTAEDPFRFRLVGFGFVSSSS